MVVPIVLTRDPPRLRSKMGLIWRVQMRCVRSRHRRKTRVACAARSAVEIRVRSHSILGVKVCTRGANDWVFGQEAADTVDSQFGEDVLKHVN